MGGITESLRKGEVRIHEPSNRPACVVSSDGHNWSPWTGMVAVAPIFDVGGPDPVTIRLSEHDPVHGFVHVANVTQVGVDELGAYKGMLIPETIGKIEIALMKYFDLPYL